jgi:small subunit ribosomal protein S6
LSENTLSENLVVYEGLFIFDSNRFARERGALPKEVETLVVESGGEVLVSRLWEERRLAYPINGQRKGAYWLIYFRLPTSKVVTLTRACEINENILRQMFVRLPASLVEPIIEHAKGSPRRLRPKGETIARLPRMTPKPSRLQQPTAELLVELLRGAAASWCSVPVLCSGASVGFR